MTTNGDDDTTYINTMNGNKSSITQEQY